MHLVARPNRFGPEWSVDLGITKETWESMTVEAQDL